MMKMHFTIRNLAAGLAALVVGSTLGLAAPATQPSAAEHPTSMPDIIKGLDARETPVLSDFVQLTFGLDKAGEAYFSRDMKWIIFQGFPKGQQHYQMYVAPLKWEGDRIVGLGTLTRISGGPSRNTCGFFSPDGNTIIFASTFGKEDPKALEAGYQREGRDYRWAFPAGMEIFRADNWKTEVLAAGGKDINLCRHPLTDNNFYDAEDAFSPDGKWICFSSMRSGDGDIYVMKSDGSHVVQITNSPGYDGGPFFSPDGKHLVYRSDRKKNSLLQVYIADLKFDAEGNIVGLAAEHQLTDDANVNWCPFYHPDGKHLIYSTSKHGHANYELYAMRTDGTHNTRITYAAGPDVLPVFSPDGNWLMWACRRSADGTPQVVVARFHAPADW